MTATAPQRTSIRSVVLAADVPTGGSAPTYRLLNELGHSVDAADSPETALEMLRQRRTDLLVVDVSRGGEENRALLDRLDELPSDRWPRELAIFTSHLDGGALSGVNENNLHEITAGINYYLHGNRFKFTVDWTYLPNGCPVDVPGLAILKNDGDSEFVIRAQLQLLI